MREESGSPNEVVYHHLYGEDEIGDTDELDEFDGANGAYDGDDQANTYLDPIASVFQLQKVCRQIRGEVSPYLYQLNTFVFCDSRTLDRWIDNRSVDQLRCIESILVPFDYIHLYFGGFRKSLREQFPRLKQLLLTTLCLSAFRRRNESVEQRTERILHRIWDQEGDDLDVVW